MEQCNKNIQNVKKKCKHYNAKNANEHGTTKEKQTTTQAAQTAKQT